MNGRLRRLEKAMGDGKIVYVFATENADGSYDCICYGSNGSTEIHIETQEEFDKWRQSDPISSVPMLIDDICCKCHTKESLEMAATDDL
jgi:hypothetical protein